MMTRFLLSILLGLATATGTQAADGALPQYPVEPYCRNLATATAMLGSNMVNACVSREQRAYADLQGAWRDLPATMRADCVSRVARINPSYVLLHACIMQSQQAVGTLGPPR